MFDLDSIFFLIKNLKISTRRRDKLLYCMIFIFAAIFILSAKTLAAEELVFPSASWDEADPESQGFDPSKLNDALSYLSANSGGDGISEVVIIRNGYMIWKGNNVNKVHGVWSATKSFTSTVLGLLIDDGKAELDSPADAYVRAIFPGITLRHFATMTSGYLAVGDEPKGSYVHGPSSTPFTPSENPLFSPPGYIYAYWDSAMNQFVNVMTRIANEPIAEFFKRRIADPIGMNSKQWNWGDFGVIDGILVNGGSGNNNKQIRISAIEIARLGHLFLNHGKWNGIQLISSSWVSKATSVQVPASIPLHQLSGADGRGVYGFNWWVNGISPDGNRKWVKATEGTYAAMGYNNNTMFVIPEWNMVIVRLGLDSSDFSIKDDIYSNFLGMISEAIRYGRKKGMVHN